MCQVNVKFQKHNQVFTKLYGGWTAIRVSGHAPHISFLGSIHQNMAAVLSTELALCRYPYHFKCCRDSLSCSCGQLSPINGHNDDFVVSVKGIEQDTTNNMIEQELRASIICWFQQVSGSTDSAILPDPSPSLNDR